MAHTKRERYSALVDEKLRNELVTIDGTIFNTKYEQDPVSGAVKIPVRDGEVAVADYDPVNGVALTQGSTTYLTVTFDNDKAVNEQIDGFDAESVPDNLVADRLDSAGFSLAQTIDTDAIEVLEAGGTDLGDVTAITSANVYQYVVQMRKVLTENSVPKNQRFLLVNADVEEALLNSDKFTSASTLGDSVKTTGNIGTIAGIQVYVSNALDATTDMIVGHPDWCSRIQEWQVPVRVQDLSGSGKFIGSSAVQGRKIFKHTVTKAAAVVVKSNA